MADDLTLVLYVAGPILGALFLGLLGITWRFCYLLAKHQSLGRDEKVRSP